MDRMKVRYVLYLNVYSSGKPFVTGVTLASGILRSFYEEYARLHPPAVLGRGTLELGMQLAAGEVARRYDFNSAVYRQIIADHHTLAAMMTHATPSLTRLILKPKVNIGQTNNVVVGVGSEEAHDAFKSFVSSRYTDALDPFAVLAGTMDCIVCGEDFNVGPHSSTECIRLSNCPCVYHLPCARTFYSGVNVNQVCMGSCGAVTPICIDDIVEILGSSNTYLPSFQFQLCTLFFNTIHCTRVWQGMTTRTCFSVRSTGCLAASRGRGWGVHRGPPPAA